MAKAETSNSSELDSLISEGFAHQKALEGRGTYIVSTNFLIFKLAEQQKEIKQIKQALRKLQNQKNKSAGKKTSRDTAIARDEYTKENMSQYIKQLQDAKRLMGIPIVHDGRETEGYCEELSFRSYKQLSKNGITSLGQLALKTEKELLSIKQFGRKSLNEIQEVLEEYGATIKKVSFDFSEFENDILTLFGDRIINDTSFASKIYLSIENYLWVNSANKEEIYISPTIAETFLTRATGSRAFMGISGHHLSEEITQGMVSMHWLRKTPDYEAEIQIEKVVY